MKNPEQNPKKARFSVGDRYLHRSGTMIRTIIAVEGSKITWEDYLGSGVCEKATFAKTCPTMATAKDIEAYDAWVEHRTNNPSTGPRRGSLTRRRRS
jgi:hypothetical protein